MSDSDAPHSFPGPQRPTHDPETAAAEPYDPQRENARTLDAKATDPPREGAGGGAGGSAGGSGGGGSGGSGSPNPPPAPGPHGYAAMLHGLAIANLFCPFLGILATVGVWQWKRGEETDLDWHAKESLNFQLNIVPVYMGLWFLGLIMKACALFGLAWVALPILALAVVIHSLIGAVRAGEGRRYTYPWIKRPLD